MQGVSRGVSREQIDRAKEINILDYILSHEPHNVKRVGRTHYLKDHDSLRISNGLWKWESQGIGGKNVVDYLMKVRGFEFVDAVRHLAGSEFLPQCVAKTAQSTRRRSLHPVPDEIISTQAITPKARAPNEQDFTEREPFKLPPRNTDNNRIIAYLESRGINKSTSQECIDKGILYESAIWHNCVFVGRDEQGKARFAAMRGTQRFLGEAQKVTSGQFAQAQTARGDFKRDAEGSDKCYGFFLPPTDRNCKTAIVFESPIDAMSHKILCPEVDGYRLSLGGSALVALSFFLKTHNNIQNIIACTDNDPAGNLTAQKIAEIQGFNITRKTPPNSTKDWNEALQNTKNEVNILKDTRKDIGFITSDYKTLFTVKDGENIKFTSGYDGEVQTLKCRFIDETHLTLIGKSHNDYHICQLAEIMERNGSKCEEIPGQKPKLDILAAKYGEPLQNVEIPMTDASIKKLVGGKYAIEEIRNNHAIIRGKDGIAVCKFEVGNIAPVHPYWAQTLKRELGNIEHPSDKIDLLGKVEKFKEKAAAQTTTAATPDKSRKDTTI